MTQAFSLTQAGTKPAEGMYAYMPNKPHVHNAKFYSGTSTDTVAAGSFVKLYGSSTSTTNPVVVAAAAEGDLIQVKLDFNLGVAST